MTAPAEAIISLCVPTRGRPEAFHAMLVSAIVTANRPELVEVIAVLDRDDRALADYALDLTPRGRSEFVLVGDRTMSDLWNEAAERATGEVLMLAADDLRFRSPGWDDMVRGAFGAWPDRIGAVWGRDGNVNGERPTHPFVHRRWVNAVGYFTPSHFVADYADFWIWHVAKELDRLVFLPDVLIEHMHVSLGKSPEDETERRKVARAHAGETPVEVWERTGDERLRDAAALRAVMA